jgi:hypothetical protein
MKRVRTSRTTCSASRPRISVRPIRSQISATAGIVRQRPTIPFSRRS